MSSTTSTSDTRITGTSALYTEQDHLSTLPLIETIDFNTTHTISSIRITPYPAGHVLGAAMFLISIAGLNILFTGDYSREPDRHLISASVPTPAQIGGTGRIDLLITESTFGISSAPPRAEREAALVKSVTNIIHRGGKVLMPVFALGRAQELLLILEDWWSRHPDLQNTPIYYTGNTARKCMVVYQTYINAMNDNIKRIFRERMAEAEAQGGKDGKVVSAGPWDFKYVRSLRNLERFDDVQGCVMLASPGMLQSGMSRILLERWAPDARNGVVMTGYNVEGTMGRTILTEPDTIPAIMSGGGGTREAGTTGKKAKDGDEVMIPRRCSVEEFSFAAHVTGVENVEFIQQVNAPHVILVHGEKSQAARLRSRLLDLNNTKAKANPDATFVPTKVYAPENGADIKIPFRQDKVVKVVGRLAQQPPPKTPGEERTMNGVIVQNGFNLSLMDPADLKEYAGLPSTMVVCKQHLTLRAAGIDLIKWALEGTFGALEEVGVKQEQDQNGDLNGDEQTKVEEDNLQETADEELPTEPPRIFLIMGCINLHWSGREKQIELEWEGNAMNDGIADAVMAVLMTVESSPAAVKYSSQKHSHHHHDHSSEVNGNSKKLRNQHANLTPEDKFSRLCMFLEEQFGDGIMPIETPRTEHLRAENIKLKQKAEDLDSSSEEDEEDTEELVAAERARLASIGIPVPGLEIKIDKNTAKLWLDNLDVECTNKVLKGRIEAIVERAVETVAPLWTVARR